MPFTPSHVAAVLPGLGRGLPATGLVVGSMIPDLPLYAPGLPWSYDTGHSWPGVVTVDVLAGLVAVVVWHLLLGPAGVAVAPDVVRRKVRAPGPPRQWPLLVVGLVLGAATHVVWDDFTHPGRWGTRHLAWLRSEHWGLVGYHWGQYGSGVLGGLAVLVWLALRWRRTPPSEPAPGLPDAQRHLAWAAVLGAGVLGAAAGALRSTHASTETVLFHAATRGGAAAGVAALVTAVVVRAKRPS